MIYKELAIYDLDSSELDIKQTIEKAIQLDINSISIPYAYTKMCKSILSDFGHITISNAIDYPFGLSDIKSRNCMIQNSIDNGAQKIDIVFQNNYLSNKKYEKSRQDIITNLEICKKNNVELTYYLEYRVFTHQSLIKACNILLESSINKVYVSTGYMLDDMHDNIIAVNLLQQKTNAKPIFTGNIWTKNHVNILKKNNIQQLRFNNLNSIKTYNQYVNQ